MKLQSNQKRCFFSLSVSFRLEAFKVQLSHKEASAHLIPLQLQCIIQIKVHYFKFPDVLELVIFLYAYPAAPGNMIIQHIPLALLPFVNFLYTTCVSNVIVSLVKQKRKRDLNKGPSTAPSSPINEHGIQSRWKCFGSNPSKRAEIPPSHQGIN